MSAAQPTAFVIMPFAKEFDSGLQDVIEPAVERAGLKCVRADQEPQGHIHQMMFERIFDSEVVVADISGANPNVFYELGVSNCISARTVTVTREDFIERVPFDIKPYRVLVYPKPPAESEGEEAQAAYREAAEEAVESFPVLPPLSLPVNEKLWSRGIEKPPRKIRVRVVKDKEGVVTVRLAEGD